MDYERPKKASCCRIRFIIALLATFCPIVCYISRQNLSMAILSMVEDDQVSSPGSSSNLTKHHSALAEDSCPFEIDESGQIEQAIKGYGPKYRWGPAEEGFLMGSFFYTYVIFQIPAARMAERIGAKWILATATAGSSLLSFISPLAASMHVYSFALVRALMGICQAALYPACYVLYTKWLPPVERSHALPILYVGAYVGSMIATSMTGIFSEQEKFGWEWAFYFPGLLCAIWSILWIWLGANDPHESKLISLEEIQHIESKMEAQPSSCKKQIDWVKLLKSPSIWAMIAAFIASNWSFTIVLMLIPSYLNNIQHIPLMKNGLINTTIYFIYCISAPLVGSGSTMMIETRAFGLSRLQVRKLFQCIAVFGQATCFIVLNFIGCDHTLVFGLLFTQIILFSFVNGGEVHLPTELSVDFGGTIYAIGNCVGSATSFIAPQLHGLMVPHKENRLEWDLYFYVAASICSLGGLIFFIFGDNHLQDFSKNITESQLDICKPAKEMNSFDLSNLGIPKKPQQPSQLEEEQPKQEKKQQQERPQRQKLSRWQQAKLRHKRRAPPPPGQDQEKTTTIATDLRAEWMKAAIKQRDQGAGSVQNI